MLRTPIRESLVFIHNFIWLDEMMKVDIGVQIYKHKRGAKYDLREDMNYGRKHMDPGN